MRKIILLQWHYLDSLIYLFSLQTFYVKENGVDLAVINGIEAIASCLRSEDQYCVQLPQEGQSMRSLGF
jgi:hypothetical protein